MKPTLLFLFPDGWDDAALAAAPTVSREFALAREGFDLFRFPENARLMWYDARREVGRLARKYRHAGVAGIVSTNEQFGALLGPLLARELGLPGADPAAVIRAQHKYYARMALARAIPEANPAFALLPHALRREPAAAAPPELPYPFFVKPVKAAYSVLARRIDTPEDLRAHLTFAPWEAHLLRRLVAPFGDLLRDFPEFTVGPERMLAESLLAGTQINVDGWFDRGTAGFFGIVDAVMFPGTHAFQRFEYPSQLPPDAQRQAYAVAERALRAIGFAHGAFNVELFWDARAGTCRVIEINPRLAAQFGHLYAKVDGTHPYSVLADLAVGRTPRWTRRAGRYGAAASCVFRAFDGRPRQAPAPAQMQWLRATHPDAALHLFLRRGRGLERERKWLGSHRYAILNLAGRDRADVERRYEDIGRHLRFERDSAWRFFAGIDALRAGR